MCARLACLELKDAGRGSLRCCRDGAWPSIKIAIEIGIEIKVFRKVDSDTDSDATYGYIHISGRFHVAAPTLQLLEGWPQHSYGGLAIVFPSAILVLESSKNL
jgi:hypothetical protein